MFLLVFLFNLSRNRVRTNLSARSSKVFIKPAKVFPPDCRLEITFLAGD